MAEDPLTLVRRQMETERAQSQLITGLDADKKKGAQALQMTGGDQDAAQYAYGNYDLANKAYRGSLATRLVDGDPMLQAYFNNNPMASIVSKDDISNLGKYNDRMIPLSQAFSNPVAWLAAPAFLNDVEKDPGGAVSVGAREFGHAIPAVVAGAAGVEPGAMVGAAIGAFGGPLAPITVPVGGFFGGLAGAILSAYLVGTAERKAVETFFPEEAERLKRGEEEHPLAAVVGSTLAAAPLFGIGGFSKAALMKNLLTRGAAGGIAATVTSVQEEIAKGEVDPLYVTGAAVGGALFMGKPTMFGEAALGLGRAIGTGRFITRFFRQGETPPAGNPVVEEGRVEDTKEVMGRFDEAIDAARQSETRNELSPDLFAKLTEQHTKADVGVKREAVERLIGDKVPEPDDGVLGDVPRINEQLELFPKSTGEDIKIPFSTLVKLNDEVVKALHDDIRPRDDLYTLNEAKEVPPAQGEWDKVRESLPPDQEDQQLINDVQTGAGLDPLFDPTGTPGTEPDTVIIKPGVVLAKRAQEKLLGDIMEIAKEREAAQLAREEKKAARRRSAEWGKEGAAMFDEVADVIDNKPDVKGWKFLTDGELRGEPTDTKPKINPASLSDEALKDFPSHWLSPDGLDADLVAGELGFNTGEDFAEAMIAFRNAKGKDTFTQMRSKMIQAETMRRLEAKYGPFEKLTADDAREIVASPKMADFIWSEWRALADILGIKDLPLTRENVKAMAALDFGKQIHTKATLIGITRELGRAGKEAHDAWAKGDLQGAFDARQKQVHLMEKARLAAEFEARKRDDNRIVLKPLQKVEPTNMEPEYADWAHQVMLWFQIPTKRTQEHLDETLQYRDIKDMASWVNSKNVPVDPDNSLAVGLPTGYQDFGTNYNPNFPIWEDVYNPISQVRQKQFDELTVREYKGVTNALRVLKKLGQDQSSGMIDIEGVGTVQSGEFAGRLLQDITKFSTIANPSSRWLLAGLHGFRWTATKLMTMDNFMSRLASQDPNNPWMKLIDVIRNAEGKYMKWAGQELAPALRDVLGKQDETWWRKQVDNPTIKNPVHGNLLKLDNGSIVTLWLVTGSRDAIEHTAAGYKMSPDELIAYRDSVSTREHFDMAMGIKGLYDMAQGHVNEMTMKRSGTILEKEQPGMVQTPWGEKPGWYYPRRRDRTISPVIKGIDPHPTNVSISLPHGFTEERTGEKYPVELHLHNLADDLERRLKYAALEPITDIYNKVLKRSEIVEGFQRHFGNEYVTMMDQFFKDISGVHGNKDNLSAVMDRFFGGMSGRNVTDAIGFNLGTIEKHSTQSIAQSIADLGLGRFGAELFKQVTRDLTRSNTFTEGIDRNFIRNGGEVGGRQVEGSYGLYARRRDYGTDPKEVARELMGWRVPTEKFLTRDLPKISMFVLRTVDQHMSELTYAARYRQKFREQMDLLTDGKTLSPQEYKDAQYESHKFAVNQAERTVALAHGSSSIVNKPEWLRSQNAMVRTGAMAMNFFNNALNRRMRSYYMIQDLVKGRSPRDLHEDVGAIARDIFIYGVLPTLIEDAVEPICKMDDNNWQCAGKFALQGLFAPIPIARDIVHGLITGTEPTYGIWYNTVKYATRLGKSATKAYIDEDPSKYGDVVENFMGLTGGVFGIPGAYPGKWMNYGIKYYQGEEDIWRDWSQLHRIIRKGKPEPTTHEEERQTLYRRIRG